MLAGAALALAFLGMRMSADLSAGFEQETWFHHAVEEVRDNQAALLSRKYAVAYEACACAAQQEYY